MSGVTSSYHGQNYAANIYAARHQEALFPFQMHFSSPASFPLENYYMPSPFYPHLTESLNLKLNQSVYKIPTTASSYELEIGKMLSNNPLPRPTVDVRKVEANDKSLKEKENEVTSSGEIPPTNCTVRLKSTQALYESATKLLFLSIRWAKSIPSFNQLSLNEQRKLLNDSWAELFIIAASQWGLSIDDEILAASPFLKLLQNVIKYFASLKIDHFEAACLKALILFRGDPNEHSAASQQVLLLQNQTLCLLIEKCVSVLRFGNLLLILPHIKMVGDAQSLQVTSPSLRNISMS